MSDTQEIGELLMNSDGTRVGTTVFNGDNLKNLYERLSGVKYATIDNVKTKFDENKDSLNVVNVSKIKSFNIY